MKQVAEQITTDSFLAVMARMKRCRVFDLAAADEAIVMQLGTRPAEVDQWWGRAHIRGAILASRTIAEQRALLAELRKESPGT